MKVAGNSMEGDAIARLQLNSEPAKIVQILSRFTGPDLTQTIGLIEGDVRGVSSENCGTFLERVGAGRDTLSAAATLKRLAGQIDVTIHALGILMSLPHILEPREHVEYVSLGAGNTGRPFDLETNLRVAEFKFIRWRGGPESIRQNSIFKDYVQLAANETAKRKHLYLLGTEQALKFFRGGRALSSVLSRDAKLQKMFSERFGGQFRTVREYFAAHGEAVKIEDVSPWLSELAEHLADEPPTADLPS